MHINDILNDKGYEVYCINSHQSIHDAMMIMTQHNVGSVLVMEKDQIKGILTKSNIILAFSNKGDVNEYRVTELMSDNIAICNGEDHVEHILNVMNHHHLNYLPVLDNNKLCGVISRGDLIKAVLKAYQFENRLLKRYIQTWPDENRSGGNLKLIVNNKFRNSTEISGNT